MYIHEIKLTGGDKFATKFNKCSELFAKSQDETLSDDERKKYFDLFVEERISLELGMY